MLRFSPAINRSLYCSSDRELGPQTWLVRLWEQQSGLLISDAHTKVVCHFRRMLEVVTQSRIVFWPMIETYYHPLARYKAVNAFSGTLGNVNIKVGAASAKNYAQLE